jgi:periplasmic protein TonB
LSVEILFAQKMDSASAQAVDTTVFTKVDIEPSVDIQQWIDHLTKNLQPYIDKAAKNGMKPGQYTINVRFLVEKDGSISYAEALNDPGFGLAKGAVKVLKNGPKWNPGEEKGREIRSFNTQPITFVIQKK